MKAQLKRSFGFACAIRGCAVPSASAQAPARHQDAAGDLGHARPPCLALIRDASFIYCLAEHKSIAISFSYEIFFWIFRMIRERTAARRRSRQPEKSSRIMLTRTADYNSVSEKAYRRIRSDIIFGKLAPGEKLKLERLARGLRRERRHAARTAEPPRVGGARDRGRPARI